MQYMTVYIIKFPFNLIFIRSVNIYFVYLFIFFNIFYYKHHYVMAYKPHTCDNAFHTHDHATSAYSPYIFRYTIEGCYTGLFSWLLIWLNGI